MRESEVLRLFSLLLAVIFVLIPEIVVVWVVSWTTCLYQLLLFLLLKEAEWVHAGCGICELLKVLSLLLLNRFLPKLPLR